MSIDVFKYSDYKDVLKSALTGPEALRGSARKIAEAAGCQRPYLSSVLHGTNHLTPDHACGIAAFWDLPERETEYFLLLVDHARCGTQRLRARLEEKLAALRAENENLSSRLGRSAIGSSESAVFYYSSWLWSAAHILVSIPEFQSHRRIAQKLGIAEGATLEILEQLERFELIRRTGTRWIYAGDSLHLPKASPLAAIHHGNWRQKAILHAQTCKDEGLHFTNVTAISADAYLEIQSQILNLIDRTHAIAGPSRPEELVCLNIDFFKA